MNKNLSLIIVAIAILLIVIGGYLIFTNPADIDVSGDSFKIPLNKQNFEFFEIETPEGSNFTIKNEADGMKYYQNTGNYSGNISGIIISKGLTDSLIGDTSVPVSNSTTEQIYSFELKNETCYKYVSNQNDTDIIIIGNDLNLLKEVSETIKIKDTTGI